MNIQRRRWRALAVRREQAHLSCYRSKGGVNNQEQAELDDGETMTITMKNSGLVLLALSLFAACDDQGGSGSSGGMGTLDCPGSTTCGGDPTGTWKLVQECLPASRLCAGTVVSVSELDWTITFGSDQSYTETKSGVLRITLPPNCSATDGGFVFTCDYFKNSGAYTCIDLSDGGCDCSEGPGMTPITMSGIWSTSQNTLSIGVAGGPSGPARNYCVEGDALRYEYAQAGIKEHFQRQ